MALSAEVAGGEALPDLHRIRWAPSVRPTTAKKPLGLGRKQAKQLKLPAPGEDGVVPLQVWNSDGAKTDRAASLNSCGCMRRGSIAAFCSRPNLPITRQRRQP